MWNKYLVELQKKSPYHLPSILHVDAMLGCVLDRTALEVEEQMSIWFRFLHHDDIGIFLDRYDRLESVPRLGLLVEIYRG